MTNHKRYTSADKSEHTQPEPANAACTEHVSASMRSMPANMTHNSDEQQPTHDALDEVYNRDIRFINDKRVLF